MIWFALFSQAWSMSDLCVGVCFDRQPFLSPRFSQLTVESAAVVLLNVLG